jgi:hypothetical protein
MLFTESIQTRGMASQNDTEMITVRIFENRCALYFWKRPLRKVRRLDKMLIYVRLVYTLRFRTAPTVLPNEFRRLL